VLIILIFSCYTSYKSFNKIIFLLELVVELVVVQLVFALLLELVVELVVVQLVFALLLELVVELVVVQLVLLEQLVVQLVVALLSFGS
jgi:hypothetical protein